jgi:hypothetical protein
MQPSPQTPSILGASDKAGTRPVILGSGHHTYEVIGDDWAKRPADKPWGNTHAVQESADGRIFVHHTGPEAVHVYDAGGSFIEAWGAEFAGTGHGMDLRREGGEDFLYFAAARQHRVVKTNLKGEHVFELSYPAEAIDAGRRCYAGADRYLPTFVAFGRDEEFYVTDGYGSYFVHRYGRDGNYISTFGGPGAAPGQFNYPHGIWFDTRDPSNPMVLVADRANVRLQWFTPDGCFVKQVIDDLRFPCHFGKRGTDLLIPDLKGRVTILDKDNRLVCHLGDNPDQTQWANNAVPREQLVPGRFCTPHGAIWDSRGDVYVAEWLAYGRVTKLRHVHGRRQG